MSFSSIRKTIINILTIVLTIGPWIAQAVGVISVPAAGVISGVVALAGAILHYLVPNTTTDPNVAANQSVILRPPKGVSP